MTIGQLSRRTGIAASAIRYYEEGKLLPPPARVNGRRVYDDDAVARLTVIEVAKDAGFTLAEIRQLVHGFTGERWKRLAERKLAEIDATAKRLRMMERLLRALLECGCFELEACGRVLRRMPRAALVPFLLAPLLA